jgi:hypothetical protein
MLLIFYFPEKNISSLLLTGINSVTATRHGPIPRLLAKGAEGGSNCDSRLYLLQLLQFYFTISQTTVKTYHRYLKFWATLDCEMILSGRQSFPDGTDPPVPTPCDTPRAPAPRLVPHAAAMVYPPVDRGRPRASFRRRASRQRASIGPSKEMSTCCNHMFDAGQQVDENMLQPYVSCVLDVCCICFIWMLQK